MTFQITTNSNEILHQWNDVNDEIVENVLEQISHFVPLNFGKWRIFFSNEAEFEFISHILRIAIIIEQIKMLANVSTIQK